MAAGDLSKTPYEKLRDDRVQENKRKLAELGVLEAAGDLNKARPVVFTPQRRAPARRHSLPTDYAEIRKSARVRSKPAPVYKEIDAWEERREVKMRRTSGGSRSSRSPFWSPLRRGFALEQGSDAEDGKIGASLGAFVKAMLHSHIASGFWLGLPSEFCASHLPDTIEIYLLTVDGDKRMWESKYLPHKCGLSGGWRGFSLDQKLAAGDCLVFELVTERKFKVHIFRMRDHGGSPLKAEDAAYKRLEDIMNAAEEKENCVVLGNLDFGADAVLGAQEGEQTGEGAVAKDAEEGVKVEGKEKKRMTRLGDIMKVTKARPEQRKK